MSATSQQFMPYLLYTPGTKLSEIQTTKVLNSLLAELLGTLFLVLIGCGSCMGHGCRCAEGQGEICTEVDLDIVRIALAFGLAVATLAQSIGHISGCHVNPAVTVGLVVGRKISIAKGVLYIIAQCVGALIGAGILQVISPAHMQGECGLGNTSLSKGVGVGAGVAIEFFITFFLVLVIYGAAVDENNQINVKGSAPLAIGLSITACHLFAVPFTGSSMNPARSFGPAVITGCFQHHWVYWVGPCLGGTCAGMVYQMLFKMSKPEQYSSVDISG